MKMKSIISQSVALGLVTVVTDVCWNGAITYFYIKNMGLSAKYATIVWAVFSVWNAINNVLTGSITDRYQGKHGRRIPFIRVFGPFMGLFFCLCFFKLPFINSQLELAISFLLTLSLLDFAIAFLETALYSIPYEETLVQSVRGKVFIYNTAFFFLSILVSMVIIPAILPEPGESPRVYRTAMCAIGIIAGIGVYISGFFIDSEYRPDYAKVKKKKCAVLCV